MKKLGLVGILMMASAAFADGGSSTAGVPNPASKSCLEKGGSMIAIDQGGFGGNQDSFCRLKDGSLIPQWTLFRAQGPAKQAAVELFLSAQWHTEGGAIEGWAAKNCARVGGRIQEWTEHLRPSLRYEVCSFSDGSGIEAWTLYAGKGYYPELAALLR